MAPWDPAILPASFRNTWLYLKALTIWENIGGLKIGEWTIFRQIRQCLNPPKFPSIWYCIQ